MKKILLALLLLVTAQSKAQTPGLYPSDRKNSLMGGIAASTFTYSAIWGIASSKKDVNASNYAFIGSAIASIATGMIAYAVSPAGCTQTNKRQNATAAALGGIGFGLTLRIGIQ